jgi:TRAP-type C4-dicarboxylate transport system permease large subunit
MDFSCFSSAYSVFLFFTCLTFLFPFHSHCHLLGGVFPGTHSSFITVYLSLFICMFLYLKINLSYGYHLLLSFVHITEKNASKVLTRQIIVPFAFYKFGKLFKNPIKTSDYHFFRFKIHRF